MPIQSTERIWRDGRFVSWADATIHVLTHSLHYGSGVFEGIRAYSTEQGPAVFRLGAHIDRLRRSAEAINVEIPFSRQELIEAAKATVAVNGLDGCYLRPIAIIGDHEMVIDPPRRTASVLIAGWPWAPVLEPAMSDGVRLKIVSWQRVDCAMLPTKAKATGIYLNSMLAKMEAADAGYDEALLLNARGDVAECSVEHLFMVRNGRIITPALSDGVLDGITRDTVITLARDLGFEVEQRSIRPEELFTSDEVFVTGTAAEIAAVREIDDVSFRTPGPITTVLRERYRDVVHGRAPVYADWLDLVVPDRLPGEDPTDELVGSSMRQGSRRVVARS